MKTIQQMDIADKRLLIRADFNVPLGPQGEITDDSRIRAVLPTIRLALEKGAKLILCSHLGRPKGKKDPKLSLGPVAARLSDLLDRPVSLADDCVGEIPEKEAEQMVSGDILLLENLRFHEGEKANDQAFAKGLARLCDCYVNDAFAVSHRAHASVAGVTEHVSQCGAGFLLQKEIAYFQKAMHDPRRPLAAVIGGAKVSGKLEALRNLMNRADKILIGGAMANTFLKARGFSVGASKVEDDLLDTARDILAEAAQKDIRLYLPVDGVVAAEFDAEAVSKKVPAREIPEGWRVLDIGPATALLFAQALEDAKTIVWNGPMGAFEMDPFSRGTLAMAETIANAHALSIVGGGDTNAAVLLAGESDRISYISTGGGAFLTLLEGKTLPGVAALEKGE